MADKRIKDLTNTAAESDLVSGNYLALDGSAGTKKLNSTTLLTKTAQNALAGNVAPAFDPTRTSENPYKAGESVVYEGETYTFKVDHYGAWDVDDVEITSVLGKRNYTKDYGFGSEGVELDNPIGLSVSDYIPVSNGMTITFFFGNSNIYRSMRLYDENKDFVDYYGEPANTSSRTITVSSSTFKYVRFTFTTGCGAFARVGNINIWKESPDGIVLEIIKKINEYRPEEIYFVGKGSSYSYGDVYAHVLPGHKYRFYVSFPWSATTSDSTHNKLNILYKQNSSASNVTLLTVRMLEDFKQFYDVIIPNDAEYDAIVSVGGRKTSGEKASVFLFDITELQTDFDEIIKSAQDDLIASCKLGYGNASSKNFQFAVLTDTHGDTTSVKNVVALANDSSTIDMVFSLGDIVRTNFNDPTVIDEFFGEIDKSTKPVLSVVGNHDVGFGYYVGNGCNHQQAYDTFIKPIVDKGWLDEGCYEDGKPYYYKDIESKKIRIIAVYEYDSDLAIDETKWSLVTYDSTKPMLNTSGTYSQGDIVNVPNYTDYSFEANESINMSGATVFNKEKYPSYKFQRGYRMVRKDQAEWLCSTLISTPQDYTVVILTHNPFSDIAATDPTKLFCKNIETTAASSIQNVMATDIFAEIVNAFVNGAELDVNVKYKGDATYANTLTDGQGNSYAYNLSADFSAKNSGVKFLCYFGGHTHWDAIWKHTTYADQIQVTSMEQGFQELTASDIQKNRSAAGGFGYNSILCAAIDTSAKSVSLLKVGNRRTIDGRLRDFEILNLS